MASDPVDQLHTDLGFAAVAPQLRAVSGVWDKLAKLQAKARASKGGFAAYKQFLERCVRQIQADEDLTSEQTVAACDEHMQHVITLVAEHDIDEIENRRGGLHWEAWLAKWFPRTVCEAGYCTVCEADGEHGDRQSGRSRRSAGSSSPWMQNIGTSPAKDGRCRPGHVRCVVADKQARKARHQLAPRLQSA